MENINKAIEILQAFNEGKPIQWKDNYNSNWHDYVGFGDNLLEVLYKFEWRIKPQPTYRPYANAEEFLKASKEHGPYLLTTGHYFHMPALVQNDCVYVSCSDSYNWMQLYDIFKWQDGTPCGILEQ